MRRAGYSFLLSLLGAVACLPPPPPAVSAIAWAPVDSLDARLPPSIRVFAGTAPQLNAWYVRIDEADPAVTTRVIVADAPADLRETPSEVAAELGACVVANGGYFRMDGIASAVGLVISADSTLSAATASVQRAGQSYPVTRAALGFTDAGAVDFAWVGRQDADVCAFDQPVPNRPGEPAAAPRACPSWPVRDAVGAGPMLLRDGAPRITSDAEVFFGTAIPERHPRTAAGRTADGALVLMVVDGRQPASRGVTLDELAFLMQGVGAVDALNLDGGGSSALVVDGVRLNLPTGYNVERDVHTLLATTCDRPR